MLAQGALVFAILLAGASAFAQAQFAQAQRQGRTTAQPAPSAAASPVLAGVDARLDSSDSSARFQISLSGEVTLQSETLSQPRRIVVDLPEIAFQAAQGARPVQGLLRSFRAGAVAPGKSRIVFELNAPAQISGWRLVRRGQGVIDLVIDFEPQTAQAFDVAAAESAERRQKEALAPVQLAPRPAEDRRPVVVIDPGHGGIDPGASARGGVMEKAIVLAIGLKLREVLDAQGGFRVVMTRADDRFLSLADRVRTAREQQADLFISLHADSLSAAQDVRGATVYTGSERATDAESARLAQKENAADAVGGVAVSADDEAVADILMDLARRETRAASSTAASVLVSEMSGTLRMHRIPLRSAGFRVLTAPDVPSVLIELGYLSSKSDIELLTSAEWQKSAADAIARAVMRHFLRRSGNSDGKASISP
jgi:N-acetylmuramoyl-L-alanine amidase